MTFYGDVKIHDFPLHYLDEIAPLQDIKPFNYVTILGGMVLSGFL
jgi:hypothetical protein